jgi:hypothetical protein
MFGAGSVDCIAPRRTYPISRGPGESRQFPRVRVRNVAEAGCVALYAQNGTKLDFDGLAYLTDTLLKSDR